MTSLDFIASLEGESKAAALTMYNLMTPQWVEVTDDPATLPEMGKTVIIRDVNGRECIGFRDGVYPDGWGWNEGISASWDNRSQCLEFYDCEDCEIAVTHWRPI